MEREPERELDLGRLASELDEAMQIVLNRYDDDKPDDDDVAGLHEPQKIAKGFASGRKSEALDININLNINIRK